MMMLEYLQYMHAYEIQAQVQPRAQASHKKKKR